MPKPNIISKHTVVKVHQVKKDYSLGKTMVHALKNVSLAVESGEFLTLSGPSGSGKTTLLNLMGCIEKPSNGDIVIDGQSTVDLDHNQLANIRAQKIGYIFQNFNLLPVLTALENVEYPLVLKNKTKKEMRGLAEEALKQVGLEAHKNHRPMELSGGQRQRVAIARAIVSRPSIILADEPTANLDHKTGEEILDLMKKLNAELGTTFIFSTHDPKVMKRASRIVHLMDGQVRPSNA